MKKNIFTLVILILAGVAVVGGLIFFLNHRIKQSYAAKPVIYLYPEKEQEVSVRLDYSGRLTAVWPAGLIDETMAAWEVTASPDGSLVNHADGREYSYLFWEGIPDDAAWDFSQGFCVAGNDTGEFLQTTLEQMGLTPDEYNEFIVYWLPLMQEHEWNLISFQTDCYTSGARLQIDPEPDSLLRVFMAWKPVDHEVEIEAQEFEPFERNGFTVVEWGGSTLNAD